MDYIFLRLKTHYDTYEAPKHYYEMLVTTHNEELSKFFEEKYKNDKDIVIIYRIYNNEQIDFQTHTGNYDPTLPWIDDCYNTRVR